MYSTYITQLICLSAYKFFLFGFNYCVSPTIPVYICIKGTSCAVESYTSFMVSKET